MIKLIGIHKTFKNCKALRDVNLVISRNEFLAITGQSGSGKSTLLSIISGLEKPTLGQVLYDGEDISKFSEKEIAIFRNRRIGFIFQNFFLIPEYSVLENVEMPLLLRKEKDRLEKCKEQLFAVGLLDKINEKVRHLSGGEAQRLAIARALVTDPSIVYADEPCGNLDSTNRAIVMKILCELKKKGKTIILVTHDKEDAKKADRIITLKDGEIIDDFRPI
mgnify:FL=1